MQKPTEKVHQVKLVTHDDSIKVSDLEIQDNTEIRKNSKREYKSEDQIGEGRALGLELQPVKEQPII